MSEIHQLQVILTLVDRRLGWMDRYARILQPLVSLVAIVGYIAGVTLGARIVDPTPVPQKIWQGAVTRALMIEVLVPSLLQLEDFSLVARDV
jgi:hypothetical protein